MSTLEELKKYNFNFTKKFGQNFIFDTNLLSSIVSSAGIDNTCDVLEIGAGGGTLTDILSQTAKRVVSFEIDNALQDYLTDKFEDRDNVRLVFKDVMNVPTSVIDDMFEGGYHMVANLPYYITTPIIFKFLEESTKILSLTIMVQEEVAYRLVAKENTADYGAITASIATMGEAKIIKKINRRMFTPAPNVDSAIVHIRLTPDKYDIHDIKTLRRVIKSAFAMRRKTLSNNLRSSFNLTTDEIADIINTIGLSPSVRGEALSAEAFVDLANEIYDRTKK